MKKILAILVLTVICFINLTADLSDGLVVNFQFNGNLNDESGYGNNGDFVGSPIFTEDRFGNENSSISFDGDDAVRIYETQGLEFSSDSCFTFVAWYKSENSFENTYSTFLSNTPHANDKHFYLGVLPYAGYPPDKFLKFSFGGEGDQSNTDDYYQFASNIGTDELNNNWHLIVGVHNGENGLMQLYIDGILDNSYTIQAQGTYTDNTDWVLGTWFSRGGTTVGYPTSMPWYEGDLDDVRIYNRVLSGTEIEQLYHEGGYPTLETGLVAHYPFNGNANDESGNGNNGTVIGATLTTDRFGNENSAFNFDGIDDFTSINYFPLNSQSFPMSFNAWINFESLPVSGEYTGIIGYRDAIKDIVFELYYGFQTGERTLNFVCGYSPSAHSSFPYEFDSLWHQVTAVFDGSIPYLYIDGNLVSTGSGIPSTSINNGYFVLGSYNDGYNGCLDGMLDDIRIYNRALSESEVDSLYHKEGWPFIANFISPETTYIGEPMQFTDTSSGNPTEWFWDFENDGIYDSFLQNPSHIYNSESIYSVKLKISNGTLIDSLIKENLIDVTYCPPVSPDSVLINVVYPDAVISWTEVDTTDCGSAITPDGYIVKFSENDGEYFFLNFTTELSLIHTFVAQYSPQMFYKVITIKNYNREQIEYLQSLNNLQKRIKWFEVKQNLEKRK